METINIENDAKDIHVSCPHCGHCESHPTDEQRHHIQTFDIVEWLDDVNDIEQSKMKCHVCKNEFQINWNYDNSYFEAQDDTNALTCSECASDVELCECLMSFKISGYYKDDKREFENYLVSSSDDVQDDDAIFFYGLNESNIKTAIAVGEGTGLEFVITSYSKV